MNKEKKLLSVILSIQFVIFLIFLVSTFLDMEIIPFFVTGTLFTVLGIVLLVFDKRFESDKKLRKWVLVNGISSVSVLLLTIFHNLFYALGELVSNTVLNTVISILGGLFFILAVVLAPLMFLVSIIVLFISIK